MKLALIRGQYTDFGGAERYVNGLAHKLLELGHEVHILARQWAVSGDSELIFHPFPSGNGFSFLKQQRFANKVKKFVETHDFDLVHSFDRTYSQDVYRAGDGCHREHLNKRARAGGWKQELSDRANPRHWVFLDMEKKLYSDPRLKIVIANSERGKREIIEHYNLAEEKIKVIYNGLDKERFNPGLRDRYRDEVRAELGLSPDEPVALFIGTGFNRKGLAAAIKALPATDAKLLVVGRGRIGKYEALASKLDLKDRILFLGPRKDVDRLYGAADIFVLPSLFEPFSNACLEAMAAGLPVVTCLETGAAEVIEPGSNGYVIDFLTETDQLSHGINTCLKIKRETVISKNEKLLIPFNWETNSAETLKVYQQVLDA